MFKQNRTKTLVLCVATLLGCILLSLNRVQSLEALIATIQQEFPTLNIHTILVVLVISGTLINALFQAWIIHTLLRIKRVKSSFLKALELFVYASFLSLLITQPFFKHNALHIMSGITLALLFALLSHRIIKKINLSQRLVVYTYGCVLGALQIWLS